MPKDQFINQLLRQSKFPENPWKYRSFKLSQEHQLKAPRFITFKHQIAYGEQLKPSPLSTTGQAKPQ